MHRNSTFPLTISFLGVCLHCWYTHTHPAERKPPVCWNSTLYCGYWGLSVPCSSILETFFFFFRPCMAGSSRSYPGCFGGISSVYFLPKIYRENVSVIIILITFIVHMHAHSCLSVKVRAVYKSQFSPHSVDLGDRTRSSGLAADTCWAILLAPALCC